MKGGRRYALSFGYFNPYELHGATKTNYETRLQQEPSLPRIIESHVNILRAKWSWTINKYLFLRFEIGKESTISIWKLSKTVLWVPIILIDCLVSAEAILFL
jgi:hypothetical protein